MCPGTLCYSASFCSCHVLSCHVMWRHESWQVGVLDKSIFSIYFQSVKQTFVYTLAGFPNIQTFNQLNKDHWVFAASSQRLRKRRPSCWRRSLWTSCTVISLRHLKALLEGANFEHFPKKWYFSPKYCNESAGWWVGGGGGGGGANLGNVRILKVPV